MTVTLTGAPLTDEERKFLTPPPDLSDDDAAAWEEAKDRYLAGRDAYQRRDIEALRKIPGYHPMAELPGSPQRFRADVFYGSKQRFEKRAI